MAAKKKKTVEEIPRETASLGRATLEIGLPFFLAGLGMVLAGKLLDHVQHWPVFQQCPELFILVPALLGLKGNLEMTLASRLSTWTNVQLQTARDPPSSAGDMASVGGTSTVPLSLYVPVALGNLALAQVQAVLVGTLAALFALLVGWVPQGKFDMEDLALVTSSSVVTASAASFILGVVMVFIIFWSGKLNVNPDNVATPIAASLGDLVTLTILSFVASYIHSLKNMTHEANCSAGEDSSLQSLPDCFLDNFTQNPTGVLLDPMYRIIVIPSIIMAVYFGAVSPYAFHMASQCPDTRPVLYSGWTPVLIAMVISSLGGTILNQTIALFPDIASYQPVINGVAGNLVSVQASRISTELHRTAKAKKSDDDSTNVKVECHHQQIEALLLAIVVPGHLLFNLVISLMDSDLSDPLSLSNSSGSTVHYGLRFLALYLGAAVIQVGLLLRLSGSLVHWLWRRGIDPDSAAIPYLTALGDLLGGALLAGAFHLNQILQL